MSIAQSMILELDFELKSTRKVLERLPAEKWDWSPHPRSMTVKRLASHLATIPTWGVMTLSTESLDINPPGGAPFVPPENNSPTEAVAMFDKGMAEFRAALEKTGDEAMMAPWSLLSGGETVFTQPRAGVLSGMIIKHLVHHRGQLSVYLRLLDIPVPSIYGPSADEQS
jgi:uncharacterized damage-inducible protein DinB